MSKKRFDVDKALNELTENVKRTKPTHESLLNELDSSINTKSKTPQTKPVERKSFRQKDSLGFQIQNQMKYVPKIKYSWYFFYYSLSKLFCKTNINATIGPSVVKIAPIIAMKRFEKISLIRCTLFARSLDFD